MRPFIIDDDLKNKLAALASHAEKNPFSMDDLLDIMNRQEKAAGDYDEFTLLLPFGYKLVYSIEQQPRGMVRHLSISVDEDEKLPAVPVVVECMKLLGFKHGIEECATVYPEKYAPNRMAINVIDYL